MRNHFRGIPRKILQFQEESDEESTRANLQPSRATPGSKLFEPVANCSKQTANQNTNIAAEVYKVARKTTSGLTVKNAYHFLNQSEVKLKPMVTCSHAFARA